MLKEEANRIIRNCVKNKGKAFLRKNLRKIAECQANPEEVLNAGRVFLRGTTQLS